MIGCQHSMDRLLLLSLVIALVGATPIGGAEPSEADPDTFYVMGAFMGRQLAPQAIILRRVAGAAERRASQAYLDEIASQDGVERTASGMLYEELVAGSGASPEATDMVEVHYHGTLRDGSVFDSSVDRGAPARFPLNRVIPCWTEGVQRMKVGGKARLVCPSNIAYGDKGFPPKIPAGAVLTFEVELLQIVQ